MDKMLFKKLRKGLPRQSSALTLCAPNTGARLQALVRELDPRAATKSFRPQLKITRAATRTRAAK